MKKLTLSALFFISSLLSLLCQAQCHLDDWTALKALYEQTQGIFWANSWGGIVFGDSPHANCDLGDFYGIHLNNDGRVNCIDFDGIDNCKADLISAGGNNLNGIIPPELGKLAALEKLYLAGNKLNGHIPEEIGNLNKLIHLDISYNFLSGAIPSQIGTLSNLTEIKLFINNLTGTIPPEIGNLQLLKNLSLGANKLTGSIPVEIGNLNNLERLSLVKNQLTGPIPPEIGNLTNLKYLYIGENELSGSIPNELQSLDVVYRIYLSDNNLTGNIPPSLSILDSLICLEVNNNQLSGCFAPELLSLCNLECINIDDGNYFSITWEEFCLADGEDCVENNTYPLVGTNYSGNVFITLDNNLNLLQNHAAKVYDYNSCSDYNNLEDCSPVEGLDNLSANEGLWIVTKAAEYFSNNHNIEIGQVNILVNYSQDNPNRAFYNSENNVLVLGSGDGEDRSSMCAPDILGHEYAHAIVNFLKPLGDFGIPGALHESYADILGELIENYCYDNSNWIYGSQVLIDAPNMDNGLRNLSYPKDETMRYQLPHTYKKEYWINIDNVCFHEDKCGIHTNSGIHSYWFYLLANGGSGTNDNGFNYNVNGIGLEKASKIVIKNLTDYLNPSITYIDAMVSSVKTAICEFGKSSEEVNEVIKAWHAVGINYYDFNPITWRIINTALAGNVSVVNQTTIIPYQFDLSIDSLGLDMSADRLSFTLHLPSTHQDLTLKEIYPPLNETEVDTFWQNGTLQININRSQTAAKTALKDSIKSGNPLFRFGVCIDVEDVGGECLEDQPIAISGFTNTYENLISFKPATMPVGSNCPSNDSGGEPVNTLVF